MEVWKDRLVKKHEKILRAVERIQTREEQLDEREKLVEKVFLFFFFFLFSFPFLFFFC